MIRTRDFILFILALVLLGVAITFTVNRKAQSTPTSGPVAFNDADLDLEAVTIHRELDRQSIIARLRSKLADSAERIEVSPSVEAPVVEEDVPEESVTHLQKCLYPDDSLTMIPKWPFSQVQMKIENNHRIFYTEEIIEVPSTGTTTASSTPASKRITKNLLQLPLVPIQQAQSLCVPSEVIGVTQAGLLVFNSAVGAYAGVDPDTFIGYARDGFPIYGNYAGEVDSCGGYVHPAGYRYTVSADRTFILGCYSAVPNNFSL